MEVVNLLANDTPLSPRNFDHPLSGDWSDHRDCHLRPDLILIYRKPDSATLEWVRLGSQRTRLLNRAFSQRVSFATTTAQANRNVSKADLMHRLGLSGESRD